MRRRFWVSRMRVYLWNTSNHKCSTILFRKYWRIEYRPSVWKTFKSISLPLPSDLNQCLLYVFPIFITKNVKRSISFRNSWKVYTYDNYEDHCNSYWIFSQLKFLVNRAFRLLPYTTSEINSIFPLASWVPYKIFLMRSSLSFLGFSLAKHSFLAELVGVRVLLRLGFPGLLT